MYLNLYDALLHNCYYLYHLPIWLFKTDLAWSDQEFFKIFIFQNLLVIVTVKKHSVSVIYIILSGICSRIMLRWYNFKSCWIDIYGEKTINSFNNYTPSYI